MGSEDLDDRLPDPSSLADIDKLGGVLDQLKSPLSLSKDLSALQSFLSSLGDSINIVQTLEGALRALSAVS